MSDRTIIVGMHVPLQINSGADNSHPGLFLWNLLNAVSGVSQDEFNTHFDLINLCDDTIWNPLAARAKYDAIESAWAGRRVLLLGRAVLGVLWLAAPPYDLRWRGGRAYQWCSLPYPDAILYDNDLIRIAVGLRLEQEMTREEAKMDSHENRQSIRDPRLLPQGARHGAMRDLFS